MQSQRTRSVFKCPLFSDICELKENVLPTYEDVMKYYEWTRHQLKLQLETAKEPTFAEIADIVTSKIENIWQTASIPIVTRTRIIQMLKAYHLKCKNLLKSIKRLSPEKLESFRQSSKILFDISACKCKVLSQCICAKDKKVPKQEQTFLIDQRTSRMMIISGIDVTATKKLQKTLKRKYQRENRPSTSTSLNTTLADLDISTSSAASSSSDSENPECIMIKSVPEKKTKKSVCVDFPTLSKTCDRYGVSDRAAAAIASSVLFDIGSDFEIIDRHKVRRERSKIREKLMKNSTVTELMALYFDGRKDKTLKIIKKGGKCYRTTTVEAQISLIQEPGSNYMGYVVPEVGTAKGIQTAITGFLLHEEISQDSIMAIGCDGTNVNTGKYGGIIRLLEKKLQKPLQWIICLLHMNELPLRHLFVHLDGCTSGPKSYVGPLGKALEACENLPVKKFERIEGQMLPEMANDLSTDQQYLHKIVSAVILGVFPKDLENKSPGKLSHARWITRANRILRLYVATEKPTENLITLATFVVKVYAPSWFLIKSKPSCKDGTHHLFNIIVASRYLPETLKKIIDPVIQRNGYFAHPENILLAMITDERKHIRELAARRILKARSMSHPSTSRLLQVPLINFNATSYIDLINWQENLTEPPLLKNLSDHEFQDIVESGGESKPLFLRLPCHTQAVERAVKITTEASISQCTKKSRLGAIKAKLESRNVMPKFETKKDFQAK